MTKQIILLNGPSSSGKSTLAKVLRQLISEKRHQQYGIVSIDDFLEMSADEPIYEDDVFAISSKMCEKTLELLKTSDGVIIDHVITSERIFSQLKESLSQYKLYMIKVFCPIEILREREKRRGNRCPGSAEASLQYLFPKDDYDLAVDTNSMTTAECAGKTYRTVFCDLK